MSEKGSIYLTTSSQRGTNWKLIIAVFTFLCLGAFHLTTSAFEPCAMMFNKEDVSEQLCPLPTPIEMKELDTVRYILNDPSFREEAAGKLSGAVQIDTVVYDIMEKSDYDKFINFHSYLEKTFPEVYERAQIHKVNDWGLVFEFPGKNEALKPVLLMAHQDTVPIGDENDWSENPWSGRYDGEKVFGRGSSDCKELLIGLLSTMQKIIQDGKDDFERGLLFCFGFDEERSGTDGARHIGEWIFDNYGPNSIDHIIDEGGQLFSEIDGDYFGIVVNAEKGYIDVKVEVDTPGGHSSIPKDHTSIGIISKFLVAYEEDMFKPTLSDDNPTLNILECAAEHGSLPEPLANAAKLARTSKKARDILLKYIDSDLMLKYNVRTTQAIDMIVGGDKANALPRKVEAIINHRIAHGETSDDVFAKLSKHAMWVSKKYGLGLSVDDIQIFPATVNGEIKISTFRSPLETAPVTAINDDIWNTYTGLVRTFYEQEVFPEKFTTGKKMIISPGLMTGNTDTRHYWKVTDHIYRCQPGVTENSFVHGPNEFASVDSYLQVIAFYYNYILEALSK
ncbi:hypothetical protein DAMA08_022220 [Martiniozyma asiatica (nom. inval.)]|nr:hypothetical protein DAMA08_022220 [Martiniozyma asiatica]